MLDVIMEVASPLIVYLIGVVIIAVLTEGFAYLLSLKRVKDSQLKQHVIYQLKDSTLDIVGAVKSQTLEDIKGGDILDRAMIDKIKNRTILKARTEIPGLIEDAQKAIEGNAEEYIRDWIENILRRDQDDIKKQ